jgi:hypothetical protein
MPLDTPASALGQRFLPLIRHICAGLVVVATTFRPLLPLLMLLQARLRNTLARLDRLAARWQQGRLRPGRKRIRAPRPPAQPKPRTPGGYAWLIRLHQPLAQFAPAIEMLVSDPEIAALCAAAPQAGRLLRPWCRAFGVTPPPHLARPRAPRKPRPAKPSPPDVAAHSPAQWPFVPLRLRLRVPGLRKRKPPD